MSEDTHPSPQADSRADLTAAIRATALGTLAAGGICLYFGFTWALDYPASLSEESARAWYVIDYAFRWALRILGVAFLVAAALAASRNRVAAALSAIVEAVFALLLLVMAVETFLEARAGGGFDATVILLLIVMAISASAARHSWSLYTRGAGSSVKGL